MNERQCSLHVVLFLQKYVQNMEKLLSWSQSEFTTINTNVHQYGAFFKDTFLVICNWCCTVIVENFLQKLQPSLLIKIHYDSQTKSTKLPLQGYFLSHLQLMLHCDCCSKLFLQKLQPSLLIKIHYDSQTKSTKLPLQIPTRSNPNWDFSCESTSPPGCCFFSLSDSRL